MNPYLLNVQAAMKAPIAREGGGSVQGVSLPYQPNPGLPGYNPNHNAAPPLPGAAFGALPVSQPEPIDIGDIDSPAGAVDLGEIDGPSPTAPVAAAAVSQEAPAPEQVAALSLASGGGMVPAREQTRLGPTQWAALSAANEAQGQAIGDMAANNAAQSARDEDVYLRHALDARAREDAAAQVALVREDELRMRASDFDRHARALSQEKIDSGRVWASKSTPQKVATFISIALGGFLSGARGGDNVAWQRVNEEIERDVKAQELTYHMKRAGVEAAQTAYGMALQRYQSADAARAFARVSAMDAVAAEVQRQAAQKGGTDAANRAASALAEMQQARADQIMKGIAYIPSQYVAPKYRVANRLDTYTAREIDDKQIAPNEERGFKVQMEDRKGEWDVRKEQTKAGAEREGKQQDNSVVLPSGEKVTAPGLTEAKELRDLATQDLKIRRLVARAIQLRREGFRTNPGNKGELDSIQQQLRTSFSVAARLGALSKDDIKITDGAIGDIADPYTVSSAPERALQSYADMVRGEVSNRVKTYSGGAESAPRATGRMPGTFEARK